MPVSVGGRYTHTRTYLCMFNTSIQEQLAKIMPSDPENNMVPRSNHNNTNPFLDPRPSQPNPSLGPRSRQGETTTHPRSTQQGYSNPSLGPRSTQVKF